MPDKIRTALHYTCFKHDKVEARFIGDLTDPSASPKPPRMTLEA